MAKKAADTSFSPMLQAALEQRWPRERRIFDDGSAASLLPAWLRAAAWLLQREPFYRAFSGAMAKRAPGIHGGILCRKRYIDEQLAAALTAGIDKVVEPGAGWDNRARRFPLPEGGRWIEADFPATIESKRRAIRRAYGRLPDGLTFAPIDFETQSLEDILPLHGFRPGARAIVQLEGVTQYIPERSVRALLRAVSQAGAGSRMVFTFIRRDFLDGTNLYGLEGVHPVVCGTHPGWVFGLLPEEVAPLLDDFGWREVEQVGAEEYRRRYIQPAGRELPVMEVERAVLAEKS